ncbi:MAG: DUF885 domain-containing protein [Pseudomonadales bacterium]|nr:DUF885 domain-containing protein [Pseudomonadales bacterium]
MKRISFTPLLACLFLLITACSEQPKDAPQVTTAPATTTPVTTTTPDFNTWLDLKYEEDLDFRPMSRTRQGDKKDYDKLGDPSEAGAAKQLAWRRAMVAEMQSTFDRATLSPEEQRSYDITEYLLERAESYQKYMRHNYIFGRRGPHTRIPNFLINSHAVATVSDMDAYLARLRETGPYLTTYLERARLAAAEGIRAPYFSYETTLNQIAKVTSGEPFTDTGTSAIWKDIMAKIDSLQTSGEINEETAKRYQADARAILLEQVKPAYDEITRWLNTDRDNVSDQAQGAWALPDGKAYYAQRLAVNTTTSLSADDIHRKGLEEVARIQAQMRDIMKQTGFTGDLQTFFTFARTDPQFYFPNTDEGRQAYLDLAETYLDGIRGKLPEYFSLLPKSPLVVKRVEPYREQPGAAAHYMRGTLDGSKPGRYYVHLADMNAASKYRLENLVYHEGLPGHHMQISIQQELESIPRFRTDYGFTAFSEGWGLYAELLGKEMGFYEQPMNDFGRLSGEIWRAIRLVVDTGIHDKGWTEEQAVNYALANSSRPEASVRSEIRRYFDNPGQATAYKIGMLKILELREAARQALGDQFDIRDFHNIVLGSGQLPMFMLETRINDWIKQKGIKQ